MPMDWTSRNLPLAPSLFSDSDLCRSSAQDTVIDTVKPHQRHSPYHPMPSTNPPSISAGRCLPPIQNLQPPNTYSTYSVNDEVLSPRENLRNGFNFPVTPFGNQYSQPQNPNSLDQPRPHIEVTPVTPSLHRSCSQSGEYRLPIHSQEPDYKRCRLGSEGGSSSLEVGAWEIDALAVAKYKNAARQSSSQQISLTDMPTSWATPGNHATEPPPPDLVGEYSRKNGTWQQHPSAYPSPPHFPDDNSRRLGYPGLSPRRASSVYSGSTLSGSPETSRSVVASGNRGSPPSSPTITSTTSGFDSRQGSTGPSDSTPTFEEIYDVPQVDLAPRDTERKSILERFPMEIFMRIMLHCDWKQQIQLRVCNSNMYGMVRLDAIPWETKTAILIHEENFNPKNFPKKGTRSQENNGSAYHDSDAASSSDDDGPSSSRSSKGRKNQGKGASKPKPQAKGKSPQDEIGRFACYSCFKILPACYFEGKQLENNTSRVIKGQKKRGPNNQSDKKVDTRVEYVQVISVNTGRPAPEWLTKDKAEFTATDVESYVTEYMKRGVNCDDLRRHYKDITSDTHCIAPVRGVNPFFTAYSSATPPRCETYRPVYRVESSSLPGAGVDSSAYTYEICIPENSAREEQPMGRPHVRPCTRICQPQQQTTHGVSGLVGPSAPAPQVKDIIALRRFCIPCGAKYGAYRRECNRKIISKTEERWWVCACPKVRQAGVGRNCPDCGKSVIY